MSRLAVLGVFLIATVAACGDNLDAPTLDAPPPGIDAPPTPDGTTPDAAGNPEVCNDTVDNDGDGAIDCADSDCAADPLCNPEMMCNDGVDNDGDGATDCADSDCATSPDCAAEVCHDGVDNDGDGATDCVDPDCAAACLAGCADNESTVVITGTGLPQPILDAGPDADVAFDVAGPGWITGAATRFSITHTYDADLDISLGRPGGSSTLDLSSDNGPGEENYTDTILTDGATDSITTGTAPFTGLYQPEQPFSTFAGAPAMGTWHFIVHDDAGGDEGTLDQVDLYLCVCNGTDGCENDGDGQVDCADADCASAPQCTPETDCADGLDNDLDGLADCLDSDCNGVGTCELPEASCNDGLDNDGDMLIDCADPDCTTGVVCSTESDCGDGIDNDGDGLIDCVDPGCTGVGACAPGPEVVCDDGIDNDGDGAADCADGDCAGIFECAAASCPVGTGAVIYTATDVPVAVPDNSPATPGISTITVAGAGVVSVVALEVSATQTYDADYDMFLDAPGGTVELSTDNGASDDNYTNTVFNDAASTSITAGTAPFTGGYQPEQPFGGLIGTNLAGTWQLRVADDAAGDTGSITQYRLLLCQPCDAGTGTCELGPIACRDGVDNDGNGLIDCADPTCAADATCVPEVACNDGLDNDLDGATDCADSDCAAAPACVSELVCNDGADNDGDGAIDCADSDCAADPACAPAEHACSDGLDNDANGTIDCADPNCAFACGTLAAACTGGNRLLAYGAYDLPQVISPVGAPTVDTRFPVGIAGPIVTAAVRFDANHTYDSDIDLTLQTPTGTVLELTTDNGGSNDNFFQTVFIDSAPTSITTGTAPFTGQYQPETLFSSIAGQSSNGSWHAQLHDQFNTDGGTWNEFSLALCVGP